MAIYSFKNLEELFEQMKNDKEKADSEISAWQAALKPGDYFQRWNQLGFFIYGEILEEDTPRDKALQHYRLCKAFSVACSEGEMGDIHVSTIEKILSKKEFLEAKERRWR